MNQNRKLGDIPDVVIELMPAAAFWHRKAHVSGHRSHALREHHAGLAELRKRQTYSHRARAREYTDDKLPCCVFRASVLTWIRACTGVQQQVAGNQIFDGHVGTQSDALQVAVRSVQVDGKHIAQVHHQARPAHTHRDWTNQTLNTGSHIILQLHQDPLVSQPGVNIDSQAIRLYTTWHPKTLKEVLIIRLLCFWWAGHE